VFRPLPESGIRHMTESDQFVASGDDASASIAPQSTTPDDGGSSFAALGLGPELVTALTGLGYEEPTPIQREAIPSLIEGRDLLGQAATGTGKTAAFALPLLQRIAEGRTADGFDNRATVETSALVLVPTRELAMQVAEAVHKYGRGLGITVLPVYGGAAMEQQLRALRRGVHVVIATPGRALDHIRRGTLKLKTLKVLVLDEADEMLDMGFEEDLHEILDATPPERQTALFSATMAPRIASIASKHLKNPVQVRIAREKMTAGAMPKVRQTAYIVPRAHKTTTLGRVLDMENPTSAIVFCRTRTEVDELTGSLNARGYSAEALHGGMSQDQRDRVMRKFRAGTAELLIATDVAARGLDIDHLSHVVNFDVPTSPEAYVHRIGRTGRAGREGVAITIAEPREHRQLRNIEHLTKQKIEMATVPSVADLRARRLELTRTALREALLEDKLDGFRVVVENLASEFDLMDVAAAAVKVAHEASVGDGDGDDIEIPAAAPRREGPGGFGGDRDRGNRPGSAGRSYGSGREGAPRGTSGTSRGPGPGRPVPAMRPERSADESEERPRRGRQTAWETTRLYVGAGRAAGVRPGDLVGAIANETGIDASAIGAIEIADKFSLVEVPAEIADDIVTALRASTVKGKRVPVRRDRDE
jgi:ATP-dependent RNA helicase DeaD